jgi:hypothetical protein
MLVDAQLVRKLHRIACGRSKTQFSPTHASSSTSKTVSRCCKPKYWLAINWSCQEAFSRSPILCTTAEEVDQEVVKYVSAS